MVDRGERRVSRIAHRSLAERLRLARVGGETQRVPAVYVGPARLHFIHAPSRKLGAPALVLSHGWPGSVFEFHKIIPLLTEHFTVVAPPLPGYTLSFKPGQPRFGVIEIAETFAALMTALGYEQFCAQGGDWGCFITSVLAHRFPQRLQGMHINLLPVGRHPAMLAEPNAEEKKYLDQLNNFQKEETGYQWIQGTRPQTLAFGLTDSPAGLAAWIVEKFRAWTDTRVTPKRRSAATRYWRTSRSTGSPGQSARRSGPTTSACMAPGRSRTARR